MQSDKSNQGFASLSVVCAGGYRFESPVIIDMGRNPDGTVTLRDVAEELDRDWTPRRKGRDGILSRLFSPRSADPLDDPDRYPVRGSRPPAPAIPSIDIMRGRRAGGAPPPGHYA